MYITEQKQEIVIIHHKDCEYIKKKLNSNAVGIFLHHQTLKEAIEFGTIRDSGFVTNPVKCICLKALKPTKIYLASGIINRFMIDTIAKLLPLKIDNIEIISKWHYEDGEENVEKRAAMDLTEGVAKADIVIAFVPYGEQGTVTELTAAYYLDKKIIYCRNEIDREDDPMITGLFENKPDMVIVNTIESLFNMLKNQVIKKEIK